MIIQIIRSITQNSMDKKLFEILTVEIVGIDTQKEVSGKLNTKYIRV